MKNKKRITLIFLCIFSITILILLMQGIKAWGENSTKKYAANELLIQSKAGVPKGKIAEILKGLDAYAEEEIPQIRIKKIKVPSGKFDKVKAALLENPHIAFAEPNYIADIFIIPNDEKYPSQWHLPNISAPEGWDINTGSQNITIAVIDSGVNSTHPDLTGKVVPGYNFLYESVNTMDVNGHGTAVAGSAAAISNNFTGVVGVAWQNPIMPLVVVNTDGWATYYDIARAMTFAADKGAKVMNISIAGSSSSSTLQNAVNYAWNKGAVFFASAGNYSTSTPYYPAACSNVVAVSASNSSNSRASFSNYGSWVDITAPGVSILTTNNSGGYSSLSGTSFSSPIAAGLAALIMSANPFLTNSQVVNIILQNADDIGTEGFDSYFGYGKINLFKSLVAASGTIPEPDSTTPSVSIASPSNGSAVNGSITVSVSATDNTGVTEVELYINGFLYDTDTTEPYTFLWDTREHSDGIYELKALAYDSSGNSGQSNIVTVSVINTVPDDVIAPVVTIISPQDNEKIYNTVKINVSAMDNVGINRIEFYVDNVLNSVNFSDTNTYTWTWNTRKLKAGEHIVTVKAYDYAGNEASDSVIVYKESTVSKKRS